MHRQAFSNSNQIVELGLGAGVGFEYLPEPSLFFFAQVVMQVPDCQLDEFGPCHDVSPFRPRPSWMRTQSRIFPYPIWNARRKVAALRAVASAISSIR